MPKLVVLDSRIPEAGNGLFAMETIPQGTYLGDYTGCRYAIANKTALFPEARVCLFDVSAGRVSLFSIRVSLVIIAGYTIDGNAGDSQLVYINHKVEDTNVTFSYVERPNGRWPIARSTQNINIGDELYACYGYDRCFLVDLWKLTLL